MRGKYEMSRFIHRSIPIIIRTINTTAVKSFRLSNEHYPFTALLSLPSPNPLFPIALLLESLIDIRLFGVFC